MKKYSYFLFLLFFIIPIYALALEKIAIVNISKIFQNSSQRDLVSKQLENEFKSRATELQTMERDLQENIQRLQRDGSSMEFKDRNSLEKLIMTQREIFSSKAQSFEQDNRRRQMEERNKIINYIQEIVKDVSIKQGYNIVLDADAIVYCKNIKDLTSDVMKYVK